MKVGILTLHRAINYGAVWQCWALKRMCEKLGHDVEVIDYNPFGHYTYSGFLRHRPDKALSYVRNFRFFNRFVDSMLNPTIHTESHEWIMNNPPKDDAYIVGSDTVWCHGVVGDLINSYLLDFAPNSVRKIAYAASVGGAVDANVEIFKKHLPSFHSIAVREPMFLDDLSEWAGKDVVDVCDPTLLLTANDYQSVEKKKRVPKHYILVFDLAGDPFLKEAACTLKKKFGYKILNATGKYLKWADVNYFGLRPQEWLYIMRNADMVCTNSFHGTAFSIIFERPFVCCQAKNGGRSKTNGRAENLLTQTNLMLNYITEMSQIIDWNGTNYENSRDAIKAYRQRSILYLQNALL